MFYSTELLSIKSHSGLGVIWLAATLGPRSQTKRLSRRDYMGVDIVKSWYYEQEPIIMLFYSRYVVAPPEPLSLRLASNLMVGITRVYGQQCQIYYSIYFTIFFILVVDAQTFWTRLNYSEKVLHTSTKASKETITHALAEDISLSGEALLSGILEDLLASPEAVRRVSKSVTSKVPSLDSITLPFEVEGTTLGLDELAPWDEISTEGMKHSMMSRITGELPGDLEVPQETAAAPKVKRARVQRPRKTQLLDQETQLDRVTQFLSSEEGLISKPSYTNAVLSEYLPTDSIFEKKVSSKNKKQHQEEEFGRVIEGGIFDWEPYDHQQTPEDQFRPRPPDDGESTSIAGGLSPLRITSRSLSRLASSPVGKIDWHIPSNVVFRRESYELLA